MKWKDAESRRAYYREWRRQNADRLREYNRQYGKTWRQEHPAKWAACQRSWISRNREAFNGMCARSRRLARANLDDSYVGAQIIKGFPGLRRSNIPRVLIEAKRAQLMLIRLAREMNQ